MKALEPGITHKTEAGAVIGPIAVRDMRAVDELVERRPNATEFDVQEAVRATAELLVAARRDPVFGYVAVVAAGGIWTEVLQESYVFLPPVDAGDVSSRVRGAGVVSAAMSGARKQRSASPSALADLCNHLVDVAERAGLEVLECNPVVVTAETGDLVIVDSVGEPTRFTATSNLHP